MEISFLLTNAEGNILEVADRKITSEILAQSCGKLTIKTCIPIINVTALWQAGEYSVPRMKLPWSLESPCGVSFSFPLLLFLDQKYRVRYAVGLTNGIDDSHWSCKMNQEQCCFEITFDIAIDPETVPFEIFFESSDRSIVDVLQEYRSKILPEVPVFPIGAWDPVYCTWYAVHASLTETYLNTHAEEAVKLGFGTFIVDDGWCYDEAKRVTPETLPDWYRDIGDWKYSECKLPNLKSVVQYAQKLGLNYMFWVAPFFVGRRSILNNHISEFLTGLLREGFRIYDPADENINSITAQSILTIFRTMGLDGLKIDFIDSVSPDTERPRCRKVKNYLEYLVGKMREIKPDVLIEFRQRYATFVNVGIATAFRAGDVPFDYMENFSRCVQLRLILGDNIPIHADPVYFNNQESEEAVGRHMIASLVGVPMLSMELTSISLKHKNVIRNYLSFYKKHQSTLNHGHWNFDLRNGFPVTVSCCKDDETIIILSDATAFQRILESCSGNVIVLNMSPDNICFEGKTFDAEGIIHHNGIIPPGGRGEILINQRSDRL